MRTLIRLIIILVIAWSLVAQIFFLAVPLCLYYLAKNDGYELILIAILVDGYYQAFYHTPFLSILAVFLVGLVNLIKPQLLMYTGDNEAIS